MTDETVDVPRYRIVGGGEPTPEQLAAVVVALTPVVVVDEEQAVPAADTNRPAWQRAALLEAVGARILASPADLTALEG